MIETMTALDQLNALGLRELLHILESCRNPPYHLSCKQLEIVVYSAGGQSLHGCFVRLDYKQGKGFMLLCSPEFERANVPLELSYVDLDFVQAITVKNSRPLLRYLTEGNIEELPEHVPGMLELRRNLGGARKSISALFGLSAEIEWLIPELECEHDPYARFLVDSQVKEVRLALEELGRDDLGKQSMAKNVKRIFISNSIEAPHVELKDHGLYVYLDVHKGGKGRLHYGRLVNEINSVL